MSGEQLESLCRRFPFKSYFHFRLCRRHFEFPTLTDVGPCRPMSAYVGSDTGRSVVFENVEVAFAIVSLSLSVHKFFLVPV